MGFCAYFPNVLLKSHIFLSWIYTDEATCCEYLLISKFGVMGLSMYWREDTSRAMSQPCRACFVLMGYEDILTIEIIVLQFVSYIILCVFVRRFINKKKLWGGGAPYNYCRCRVSPHEQMGFAIKSEGRWWGSIEGKMRR